MARERRRSAGESGSSPPLVCSDAEPQGDARSRLTAILWTGALFASVAGNPLPAGADATPQVLPHTNEWSVPGQISTDDNWSGVPGWLGYRGDNLTVSTGTDPQTILLDGSGTPIDVIANQTNPSLLTAGGVAECEIFNPVVALQGSSTADAPFLLLHLSTSNVSGIKIEYDLRDIDGSTDDAIQQVALQYRVGPSGSFTNLAQGFVADATTGPSLANQVTHVRAFLPEEADSQSVVVIRIITCNAIGSDEWVGVENVSVESSARLAGAGTASPDTVEPGQNSRLAVSVVPGGNPASTGIAVSRSLLWSSPARPPGRSRSPS